VNKKTQLIFKNIVAAPHFHGIQQVRRVVKYLYKGVVLLHCPRCGPRVGPTRSQALDIRAAARSAERAAG